MRFLRCVRIEMTLLIRFYFALSTLRGWRCLRRVPAAARDELEAEQIRLGLMAPREG